MAKMREVYREKLDETRAQIERLAALERELAASLKLPRHLRHVRPDRSSRPALAATTTNTTNTRPSSWRASARL